MQLVNHSTAQRLVANGDVTAAVANMTPTGFVLSLKHRGRKADYVIRPKNDRNPRLFKNPIVLLNYVRSLSLATCTFAGLEALDDGQQSLPLKNTT